jgi:prepilin-type N-terminal cleavage/methylation domain-containing protein
VRPRRHLKLRFRTAVDHRHGGGPPGFTLVELLVVIAIIAILAALLLPGLARARRLSQRTVCLNNLRQFAVADTLYCNDHGQLPGTIDYIPSSITVARLTQLAQSMGVTVPAGAASAWPKRAQQPRWINCPLAVESGMAEGVTLGGGLYTGYAYLGGMEQSPMVTNGFATVVHPGMAADLKNTRRGVLWADILDEFATSDTRRFEYFHVRTPVRYAEFVFPADQLDGIHRAWSDGSVEWVPGRRLALTGPDSPDCRLQHVLGNYYF